jgi:hypothetical protein
MRQWLRLALVLLALPAALAAADRQAAENAFTEERWQEAFDLYSEIQAAAPDDTQAVFRAAVAMIHLGRAQEALVALRRAEELGAPPPAVALRLGGAHAALGDVPAAMAELRRAVAAGVGPPVLESDPLLAPLRAATEFRELLQEADKKTRPCRHDPRYRAFDYWLGEWDVRRNGAPASSPASENIITLAHEGCVVVENWTAAGGGTGSSFNIFDASRGKWYQTWVDSSGGLHEYSGNPDEHGNLVYHAELAGPPGSAARVPTRLTFFRLSADQVRQLSESTADQGKTWTVNYDLLYTRRPAPIESPRK